MKWWKFVGVLIGGIVCFKVKPLIQATSAEEISKPLVLISGSSYDDILKYDGYALVESNVNFDVAGEYKCIYQNYVSNEKVSKPIYIVHKETFQTGVFTIMDEQLVYDTEDEIINYLPLADGSYIVVCSKVCELQNVQEDSKYTFYVARIQNQNCIWKKVLKEECYGQIVDIKQDENSIMIVGNFYFPLSSMDIGIYRISLQGEYMNTMYYGGTLYEESKQIVIDKDSYFIVGHTTSVDGEIGGRREKEDTFLLEVEKTSLKMKKISYYNLPYNDTCEQCVIWNQNIYLLQYFISVSDQLLPSYQLLQLDKEGNVRKKKLLPQAYGQKMVKLIMDSSSQKLILIGEEYNEKNVSNQSIVYQIDEKLDVQKIESPSYEKKSIYLVDCIVELGELSLLYQVNEKNEVGYRIRKINLRNQNCVMDYQVKLEDNKSLHFLFQQTIGRNTIHQLYTRTHQVIEIKNFGNRVIYTRESNIHDYEIKINGQNRILNEERSNIKYNTHLFGNYSCYYFFSTDTVDICYQQDIIVVSNSSVKKNQVYDLYTKISFNGLGLLDGKEIYSGYVITEEGKHRLEIIGQDEKKEIYEFEIQKLSMRPELAEYNQEEIKTTFHENLQQRVIQQDNSRQEEMEIYVEKENEFSKKIIDWWALFIPLTIVSLGIFMVIWWKRK